MSEAEVLYEVVEEKIGLVTLHRPDRMNAIDGPMIDALREIVDQISKDARIRAWILRGAPRSKGGPCFSAGVDVKAFEEKRSEGLLRGEALCRAIDDLLLPSIAQIDGVCTTGAAELALACDFRVVAPSARISDWHLKNLGTGLGAWGGSTRWARLIGSNRAKEVILLGKELDGAEALRYGFANELHDSDALAEGAIAMARTLAAMKPEGVRLSLAHLDRVDDMRRDEAIERAEELPRWLGVSRDIQGKEKQVLAKKSQRGATPRSE